MHYDFLHVGALLIFFAPYPLDNLRYDFDSQLFLSKTLNSKPGHPCVCVHKGE